MSSTVKGKNVSTVQRSAECNLNCVCVSSLPRYLLFYHKQFLEYE